MNTKDRELGMHRKISRRDLLYGFGGLAAACSLPQVAWSAEARAYPPELTGMRGNHDGSFDVAHQHAWGHRRDWSPIREGDDVEYDLVVVGAGLSGLSAAVFFLQSNPGARVLILDNHDDFGGHAKRNEFDVGGRTLIGHGGSQTMVSPSGYDPVPLPADKDT